MKAVIPVAGVGSMLRPHTHTQPKPLIPVAGKPILGHIIDHLLGHGITDFVFIIGHLGEKIEDFVRNRYSGRITAEFVLQMPRQGLGHALWVTRNAIRDTDEILIVLGDTIFDVDMQRILNTPHSVIGVKKVDDPRKFGVATVEEDGSISALIEKPRIPKSNLAIVGLYKIREVETLLAALEDLMAGKPSEKGEYYLTDALMHMVRRGTRMDAVEVDNWFDCGAKDSLLMANRILLERMPAAFTPKHDGNIIIPPVHIAPGCNIRHSIIGPFVSIDEHTSIENSIIENSILGAYASLDSIVLKNSIVGSDASLRGKTTSVNIGDNTQIDFND